MSCWQYNCFSITPSMHSYTIVNLSNRSIELVNKRLYSKSTSTRKESSINLPLFFWYSFVYHLNTTVFRVLVIPPQKVSLKVFDHNLITIRCRSSSGDVAWIILNLNKSLLAPTKSYLSNSGRSDSIIPIDSICGIVHYEITLHKLCLLSRVTLPTICIYNIL